MIKKQKIAYYILLVLISLGFLFAAYPKLVANPMSVAGFAQAHLPIWFMYVVGICEVLGVIGLWIRRTAMYAAGGLFIILAGAIVVTLIFSPPLLAIAPVLFAVVLFFVVKLGKVRMNGTLI